MRRGKSKNIFEVAPSVPPHRVDARFGLLFVDLLHGGADGGSEAVKVPWPGMPSGMLASRLSPILSPGGPLFLDTSREAFGGLGEGWAALRTRLDVFSKFDATALASMALSELGEAARAARAEWNAYLAPRAVDAAEAAFAACAPGSDAWYAPFWLFKDGQWFDVLFSEAIVRLTGGEAESVTTAGGTWSDGTPGFDARISHGRLEWALAPLGLHRRIMHPAATHSLRLMITLPAASTADAAGRAVAEARAGIAIFLLAATGRAVRGA